jgi:hypothetical protein
MALVHRAHPCCTCRLRHQAPPCRGWPRPRQHFPMTTYEQSNFEQIATAIGIARVAQHKNLFEAAALWYRLGQRRPKRIAPSKLCEKLDRVAKNARRLLKSLGVNDLDEAPDGPGDLRASMPWSCWANLMRTQS